MFPKLSGLSVQQVQEKQRQYGLNVLPKKPPPSSLSLIVQQLRNPLIYVLLLAGLVTMVIGHYPDTLIIAFAVVINTILGFIQERKAANALHALKHYVASQVIAIREGRRETLDTS